MADYKEMYLHLFREVEKAVRILQQAQLDCEEMYISAPDAKPKRREENWVEQRAEKQEEREAV